MEAQIILCKNCNTSSLAAQYQDVTYGQNMRVHNPCKTGLKASDTIYRCVVCSSLRSLPVALKQVIAPVKK